MNAEYQDPEASIPHEDASLSRVGDFLGRCALWFEGVAARIEDRDEEKYEARRTRAPTIFLKPGASGAFAIGTGSHDPDLPGRAEEFIRRIDAAGYDMVADQPPARPSSI